MFKKFFAAAVIVSVLAGGLGFSSACEANSILDKAKATDLTEIKTPPPGEKSSAKNVKGETEYRKELKEKEQLKEKELRDKELKEKERKERETRQKIMGAKK